VRTRATQPHFIGAVRCKPSRRRLGGFPAGPDGSRKAASVGAGAHGHHRKRTRLPACASRHRTHPCRGTGCQARALGDGGRRKMLRPVRSDRGAVGRSRGARLHRDAAAGSRGGTVGRAVLAGTAGWIRQPQRCAHALEDREQPEHCQPPRSARFGFTRLGCGAVPSARASAGPLDRRS